MQYNYRILLLAKTIILLFSFLVLQTTVAQTYKVTGVVSGDVLNIREKPALESKTIGSIPPSGKGIKKLAPCESGWCKIQYNGTTGWSAKNYLELEAAVDSLYRVKGVRSDDVLFIRAEPSGKSKQVGSIPPDGRGVKKLGPCKDNRCKISYRGITGWSSMKYLVVDKLDNPTHITEKQSSTKIISGVSQNTTPKIVSKTVKTVKIEPKPINQSGSVALKFSTNLRQDGIKSKPYKLSGKSYVIEARGTVKYKTDPNVTDNPGVYGVDACYLFSFSPSNIKTPPVAIKLLKNTGNNDVCANARFNPRHIYRSQPFVSNHSYQFWIDNSAYRAIPTGRGFLTVNIYETKG